MTMNVYIETYGCQMNEYDSKLLKFSFLAAGFAETDSAEHADVILFNTCAVRDSAEERVFGQIGHVKRIKEVRDVIVGIIGCMADHIGDGFFEKYPFIDFVAGTDELDRIVGIVTDIREKRRSKVVEIADTKTFVEFADLPRIDAKKEEFISIMRGCNNFCTYCIVPYVRGRERSRHWQQIVEEVRYLAEHGTVDVTLLGQNVNSYDDNGMGFVDLVEKVALVKGIKRIRFTTSHPKDMNADILNRLMDIPQVCNHFHLPLQSGSDRILTLMNRKYTADHYRKLIDAIRDRDPLASITTDIIVGFHEETHADFEKTEVMMRYAEYDSAFIFKYNKRPGTKGFTMAETVSPQEKQHRLEVLNAIMKDTAVERNKHIMGATVEILVTDKGRSGDTQYRGRTSSNKIVVFDDTQNRIGQFVTVKIEKAEGWTLFGVLSDAK